MTALELHNGHVPATVASHPTVQAPSVPDGVAAIELWARTAQAASQLVERLVDSPFVPEAFRPKLEPRATPDQRAEAREIAVATATAAVLYGGEIGLSPMQSLSNVIVIKGKPGLYAETMVALVQAAGHEVWTEDVSDTRAIVCGRRVGSERVERVIFTMDRAKKAGYTRQNTKYDSDPQSMLYARAASICCRRTAPEVLKGIAVVEEILDEDDGTPVRASAQRVAQRRGKAAQPAAIEPAAPSPATASTDAAGAPPLPGEDGYDDEPRPQDQPARLITQPQQRKLHATFRDLGITGDDRRDDGLAVLSAVADRVVDTSADLTVAEAGLVIDALDALIAEKDQENRETVLGGLISDGTKLRAGGTR